MSASVWLVWMTTPLRQWVWVRVRVQCDMTHHRYKRCRKDDLLQGWSQEQQLRVTLNLRSSRADNAVSGRALIVLPHTDVVMVLSSGGVHHSRRLTHNCNPPPTPTPAHQKNKTKNKKHRHTNKKTTATLVTTRWLIDRLIWLTAWLVDWLIDWTTWQTGWLNDWVMEMSDKWFLLWIAQQKSFIWLGGGGGGGGGFVVVVVFCLFVCFRFVVFLFCFYRRDIDQNTHKEELTLPPTPLFSWNPENVQPCSYRHLGEKQKTVILYL